MRKIKVAAIAVLVIAMIVLAVFEIKTKGTISGLALAPVLVILIWSFAGMAKRDLKEIFSQIGTLGDE